MANQTQTTNRKRQLRRKKIISRRFGIGFISIYTVLTVLLVFLITKLNVLPTKYLIPLIIILVLVLIGLGYLQLSRKVSRINQLLGRAIIIIMSVLLAFGNFYIYKTGTLINNFTDFTDKSAVSIIVLKDSKYSDINDMKKATFARSTTGTQETMTKALADIDDEIGVSVTPTAYDSINAFGNALLNEEVDAIILDESTRSLLTDEFSEFATQTKIIKTYTYEKEKEENTKSVSVTEEAFNVYITGIDSGGPVETEGRSDVNMILTINPKTHQILMTSIPRDYYIPQTCQNNQEDKLTHTGMFGVKCTLNSVENYFNLDFNYYARVNFSGVWDIIDAIGGVDIDNPFEFTGEAGNFHFAKGNIHLNGEQALCYARERKSFIADDAMRIQNQGRVLEGIINKVTSPSIITKYTSIMDAVGNVVQTNMSVDEINALVRMQISDMPNWTINKIQVTGEDRDDLFSPANGSVAWVMVPYDNSVKSATNIIKQVIAGKDVTSLVEKHQKDNFVSEEYASETQLHGIYNDDGIYEEAIDVEAED